MNVQSTIGHNSPPDPIDEALAPYGDFITEAESWCDGSDVENEAQMKTVDALTKQIKAARKAVADAEESAAKPIYDAWKAEKAKYAPTLTDLDRIVKSLVSLVGDFKKKLAAKKEEARRKAEAEAWEKTRAAQEAARQAVAGDLEAQREADRIAEEAKAAQEAASLTKHDTVKGMRTVTRYEIEDHRKVLHWIAANDREAVTAFIEEYVRRNYKTAQIDGVKVWQDKEAF